MPNHNFEASKQLGCLDARIAQLKIEYEQIQIAEILTRQAGNRNYAQKCRLRSHELINALSYLISQRRGAEHHDSVQLYC